MEKTILAAGVLGSRILDAVVEEDEILEAYVELGRKGLLVEPSSAVAYASYKKQLINKEISRESSTMIILTGNGLKTTIRPV